MNKPIDSSTTESAHNRSMLNEGGQGYNILSGILGAIDIEAQFDENGGQCASHKDSGWDKYSDWEKYLDWHDWDRSYD